MLEALHLWKFYGGTAAVRDVSFVVGPGEIVGYLGANGSGKSTTARMVTGLLTPSRGVVSFKGRDIADDLVGYRQRLGYVPEEPALYGYLSGREYLEFVAQLRALPDTVVNDKVPALLRLFGIEDAAELDISGYSKGMKQKVLLIAALFVYFGLKYYQKRHATFSYELFLMTSSNEVQAFATDDKDDVLALRRAIEDAMAAA